MIKIYIYKKLYNIPGVVDEKDNSKCCIYTIVQDDYV